MIERHSTTTRVHAAESQPLDSNRGVVVFSTTLGWVAIVLSNDKLCKLTFGHNDPSLALESAGFEANDVLEPSHLQNGWMKRIAGYCSGQVDQLEDIPIDLDDCSPFQRRVIETCREIPFGSTISYGELAQRAGSPKAARAVGTVMRRNRIPLVVPCHRVVASSGLGGYSASNGLPTKQRLLAMEKDSLATKEARRKPR